MLKLLSEADTTGWDLKSFTPTQVGYVAQYTRPCNGPISSTDHLTCYFDAQGRPIVGVLDARPEGLRLVGD